MICDCPYCHKPVKMSMHVKRRLELNQDMTTTDKSTYDMKLTKI